MAHFLIPKRFDDALDLIIDERVYIVQDCQNPTQIVFVRGNMQHKNIIHVSKVENWEHNQQKQIWYNTTYAIVKAPKKIIPNQKMCKKSMCIENIDGDFIIILR